LKSIPTYLQAVRECLEFAAAMRREFDVTMQVLDFGGGFGVPTVRARDPWDTRLLALGHPARQAIPDEAPMPSDYAKPIVELVRGFYPDDTGAPELVFEPGRAITSSAQLLLLAVLTSKPGLDGATNLIMDGGKNITMPLGWESHQIFPANRMDEKPVAVYDIFGPLCHPGDIIDKRIPLPPMQAGDLIAIMDGGAYFVPNEMNFANPRPPAVMIESGQARLIRAREGFADIVRRDALPAIDD
jgi:diaminopimelate decarboxylase